MKIKALWGFVGNAEKLKSDSATVRTGGQVPSVAVIAPAGDNDEDELDAAAEKWEAKFSGPGRRPAILPNGTTVTPLGWNPSDGEAQAARKASLTDVANMFNLDGYWIGAPASSHTYRTPGAMFLVLLRTTLNPVLAPFEDTWSLRWLVRGKRVTFARAEVLEDDQHTTVNTLTKATGGPVMTTNEARTRLRLAPVDGGDELRGEGPLHVVAHGVVRLRPEDRADLVDPLQHADQLVAVGRVVGVGAHPHRLGEEQAAAAAGRHAGGDVRCVPADEGVFRLRRSLGLRPEERRRAGGAAGAAGNRLHLGHAAGEDPRPGEVRGRHGLQQGLAGGPQQGSGSCRHEAAAA